MSKKAIVGAVLLTLFLPAVALVVALIIAAFRPEKRSPMLWWAAIAGSIFVLFLALGFTSSFHIGFNPSEPQTCSSWSQEGNGPLVCDDPFSKAFGLTPQQAAGLDK